MNSKDWLAALTGVGFLVLVIVGIAVGGGEPPDPSDESVQEIINFYDDNTSAVWFGSIVSVWAGAFLIFFGGYLRKVLRAAEGEGHMLSAVAFAGTVILGLAAAIDATINVALAEAVDNVEGLEPSAVQALSILWTNDFLPFALGAQVFLLASGLSVVRHGALPAWLGWVAIVLGVAAATPVGFVAFLAGALWIGVVSIMLAMRERAASQPPAGPPAAAPQAPAA
jgi:hypothetical protein